MRCRLIISRGFLHFILPLAVRRLERKYDCPSTARVVRVEKEIFLEKPKEGFFV
jgi:hypothetical protein